MTQEGKGWRTEAEVVVDASAQKTICIDLHLHTVLPSRSRCAVFNKAYHDARSRFETRQRSSAVREAHQSL